MTNVLVIGAGPAGVLAALRAADLGARTTLVARAEFGGMAANDGPVPVRALAHASRLMREARQLGQYGVTVGEPVLDYPRLLARVREVVGEVRAHSSLRQQIDAMGVTVHQQAGVAGFADEHTIETQSGLRLRAAERRPAAWDAPQRNSHSADKLSHCAPPERGCNLSLPFQGGDDGRLK
jgi:dihydrolipoamide dehydrogenase